MRGVIINVYNRGRGEGYNKPPQSSNRFMDNNENIGALSTLL
jgi:hypothetical protein